MPAVVSAILHTSTRSEVIGKVSLVDRYHVSGVADSAAAIAAAPGTIGLAGVTGKSSEFLRTTSPHFIVTVTSEIVTSAVGFGSLPSDSNPIIEYDTWEYKHVLYKSYDSTPKDLVNKAGDRLEVETSSFFPRVSVTMQTSSDKSSLLQYVGYINDASITVGSLSIAARRAMLSSIRVYSSGSGMSLQWYVKFELLVNNKVASDARVGWFADRANYGWNHMVSGVKKAFQNSSTHQAEETWLDANTGAATTTPNYITFQEHPETTFNFV